MVDAISGTTSQAARDSGVAPAKKQGTSLASDFETFLKMLTAQAKYQDPLNPLDSAEYASQLAQFSSVEQSVRTNELLEQMVGQAGSSDLSSMASWIGKDVLTAGPMTFDGTPMTLHVPHEDGANSAELVVYNTEGKEVQRQKIDQRAGQIVWDGSDPSGTAVAPGSYTLEVERFSGETRLATAPVQIFSSVSEVRLASGVPELLLARGISVRLEDVAAIR